MGSSASSQRRDNRKVGKRLYTDDTVEAIKGRRLVQIKTRETSWTPALEETSEPVSLDAVEQWEEALLASTKNELAISALSRTSLTSIVGIPKKGREDAVDVWNTAVTLEGSPVTSQLSSGRCWIFASTNVFRTYYMKKFALEKFELSQAYLFFWDKLEKSNYLLNNIIETADERLESRVVQTILANGLSDGGQWDMIVNLVNKYGLVPKSVYSDTYHASNSAQLNYFLVNKVREFALILRSLVNDEKISKEKIHRIKEKQLQEIYNILALFLSPPPKPDQEFVWDYKDKTDKVHSIKSSPKEFVSLVDLQINDTFSLINDPRNEYDKLYTVDRLNNVVGGKPIDYVNAKSIVLKKVIIDSLKDNTPVFFGSDVGKFQDQGILDTSLLKYELAFNTKLNLTKAERLEVGSSAMTHAMVITAVHIVDGKIVRYRIENSWGEAAGNKGYFVATDEWFDEYVYQVVTSTKYAPKYLTEIWKKGDYKVLPIYDPMGALA